MEDVARIYINYKQRVIPFPCHYKYNKYIWMCIQVQVDSLHCSKSNIISDHKYNNDG
jgi:hypothetical protein